MANGSPAGSSNWKSSGAFCILLTFLTGVVFFFFFNCNSVYPVAPTQTLISFSLLKGTDLFFSPNIVRLPVT